MKLAFCLFKYHPYGGLQRDFLRIAQECKRRGHGIDVYTNEWQGPNVNNFSINSVGAKGWQNHVRSWNFAEEIKYSLRKNHYDLVIGFNKMPHLDIYYAADKCYQARMRERHVLHRCLPRYRQWVGLEKAVFQQGQPTDILLISPKEQAIFSQYYQTEPHRFHHLPPGISKELLSTGTSGLRTRVRNRYDISPEQFILLMVGSGFETKGLDRAIRALASLPHALKHRCQLWVVGQGKTQPFKKLARKLGIANRLFFYGARNDVIDFLHAADLLLHPAYHENTGTVLLEAMTAGLAVLTIDHCGYADYIKKANAGIVMRSPFHQVEFNSSLHAMLLQDRSYWRQNGLAFAKQADLYSLPQKAADVIEQIGLSYAAN